MNWREKRKQSEWERERERENERKKNGKEKPSKWNKDDNIFISFEILNTVSHTHSTVNLKMKKKY